MLGLSGLRAALSGVISLAEHSFSGLGDLAARSVEVGKSVGTTVANPLLEAKLPDFRPFWNQSIEVLGAGVDRVANGELVKQVLDLLTRGMVSPKGVDSVAFDAAVKAIISEDKGPTIH